MLTGPTIYAVDPESTAVTYTTSCGADSGHISVNPTSGVVTMVTALDLELLGRNTYTIICTLTAADATAQTSTSTLNVVVTDANDVAPVFSTTVYSVYVIEGHVLSKYLILCFSLAFIKSNCLRHLFLKM